MKGNNLRDLDFLTAASFPDVGPIEPKRSGHELYCGIPCDRFGRISSRKRCEWPCDGLNEWTRPRVRGKLTAENVVLDAVLTPSVDSSAQKSDRRSEPLGIR